MTKDEALKLALEALEKYAHDFGSSDLSVKAMYVARKTLAQRTWVGLTPQERDEINEQVYGSVPHYVAFHYAIEAKLKEKNT